MTQTTNPGKLTAKDAVRELWARGRLEWKLNAVQKKMFASYISQNQEITIITTARRSGKSYMLCLLAIEKCIQTPNAIVKYICPRKNMVKTILQPIMTQICQDCPPEMKPEFKYNDYMYVFPNGSQIQMAGTDGGHHENLRGGRSEFWIVDEAGFCDELTYVVNTILAPTADTTGGRGIIASTPSKQTDHEFISDFVLPAQADGKLIKYTIHDNPMLTKTKIQQIIDRYPLKEKDPEYRREYLCEIVSGGDLSVVPEFTEELEQKIVREWTTPPFRDSYVSMDIGGRDLTALLFAYYDFKNGKIIIEDELIFGKSNSNQKTEFRIDEFARQVKKKEEGLWTNTMSGEFKPPYLRISDNNNLILLNDLTLQYNLQFIPTRKDNREAALNTMRVMLAEEKILIHPRCKTLIHHLKNGTWQKNKKDFSRSANNGHWDAIPALMYLVRNVQENKNPYPAGYGFANKEDSFKPGGKREYTSSEQGWVNMFKGRNSIKLK